MDEIIPIGDYVDDCKDLTPPTQQDLLDVRRFIYAVQVQYEAGLRRQHQEELDHLRALQHAADEEEHEWVKITRGQW